MVYHCSKCHNINHFLPFTNDLCPECGGEPNPHTIPVIKVDPGEDVICDGCNREIPEDEYGGNLVGSWFFCKECPISHPEEITEEAPINITTKDWIKSLR